MGAALSSAFGWPKCFAPPKGKPFNRLFTIRFPSVAQLDAFFAHPEYLAIRKRLFEPSVSDTIRLGKYDVLI